MLEFAVPYSKSIILKTKYIFLVFSYIFKKKKFVIANVFPKLSTVLDLVRPLTKKHRVRTFFEAEHVKFSETLVKSS